MDHVAEYITQNYTGKTVEVGVGKTKKTALELRKNPDIELTTTDTNPETDPDVIDDITQPNIEVYHGAELLYSIRPPPEIHTPLQEVAEKIESDLLITPLGNEATPIEHRVINHGGRAMYLYPPK